MAADLRYPWAEPPGPGTTIEVAPGILWLRMPLPFQLNHINLWLLEDGDGWTAIDTGLGLGNVRALWEQIFAGELRGRPITRVLVTHFHPDHMGNAAWLTGRWQADLWCTQGEFFATQYVWRSRGEADLDKRAAHYRHHGLDEPSVARLRERGNHYPGLVPEVADHFRCIVDGELLVIGGRTWQVLVVHGHAPEHACLWCPEAGVLIAGDQVLPKITTNVSVWPEQPRSNPLRQYLDSHARFGPLPGDALVLPSHGLPFHGLHERLAFLHEHHDARLGETIDALVDLRTAAELVPVLFRRELDTHQLSFAMGETLAHLNFLEAEGDVQRVIGADGVHRFTKA